MKKENISEEEMMENKIIVHTQIIYNTEGMKDPRAIKANKESKEVINKIMAEATEENKKEYNKIKEEIENELQRNEIQ